MRRTNRPTTFREMYEIDSAEHLVRRAEGVVLVALWHYVKSSFFLVFLSVFLILAGSVVLKLANPTQTRWPWEHGPIAVTYCPPDFYNC